MVSIQEVSSIAEELWCPVCLSILQEPRRLGCGHNFCLPCLENCVFSKGQPEGSCPECQKPFSLQEADDDRVLANLSERSGRLKLEGVSQTGGTGGWYFCGEHEEPLKEFCSQDEAPVCALCRNLPQHQSHRFLPIKNAVKVYQEKLKASLEPLEDGVKQATNNQSLQQEAIEELEDLYQNLCGSIFIAFEELREVLNEREQAMMESVKQMKEDNQADMESRLEHLKACESSHAETISSIQTALKETNEVAFLKGVKELMGRVRDRLREESEEAGSEGVQGPTDVAEREDEGEEADKNEADGKGDEGSPGEGEASGGETHDADEDEDDPIVPVDPALRELEGSLDFEAWKDMLGTIAIGETYGAGFPYCDPPQEENVPQTEASGLSEGAKEETALVEKSSSTTDVGALAPSKPRPPSSSNCARPPAVESSPYKPPPCFPPFPVPLFQQWPAFSNVAVRGGMATSRWMPHPAWGRGIMSPGRGFPPWQLPFSGVGQGSRGYPLNPPRSQASAIMYGPQGNWGIPRKETPQPRRQGRGSSNKQRPQSRGGNSSGQSGGDFVKRDTPTFREVHVSGPDVGRFNNQGPQSSGSIGSGDSEEKSPNQQAFKPTGTHTVQGRAGRLQGSAKKPPTPQKEGEVASGTKGSQNRAQPPHRRGRGRGSGSTKGPQNK